MHEDTNKYGYASNDSVLSLFPHSKDWAEKLDIYLLPETC